MSDDVGADDFDEREKAIIETAVMHLATDCTANGNFDVAADARELLGKVGDWRNNGSTRQFR